MSRVFYLWGCHYEEKMSDLRVMQSPPQGLHLMETTENRKFEPITTPTGLITYTVMK